MTGHTLSITAKSGWIEFAVVCHQPAGAGCRLACAVAGCTAETWPHEGADGTDHPLADSGECQAVVWLDPADGDHVGADEPLHDGTPIEVKWDGDRYTWRGVETS